MNNRWWEKSCNQIRCNSVSENPKDFPYFSLNHCCIVNTGYCSMIWCEVTCLLLALSLLSFAAFLSRGNLRKSSIKEIKHWQNLERQPLLKWCLCWTFMKPAVNHVGPFCNSIPFKLFIEVSIWIHWLNHWHNSTILQKVSDPMALGEVCTFWVLLSYTFVARKLHVFLEILKHVHAAKYYDLNEVINMNDISIPFRVLNSSCCLIFCKIDV